MTRPPKTPEKAPGPPAVADEALWRAVVRDVKPLSPRRAATSTASAPTREDRTPRAPAKAEKPRPAPPRARPAPAPKPPPLPALAPGEAPGLDARTALRLKRGQLKIEARLDLHGMTQAEAHARLATFLAEAQKRGRRCVLVITGRGRTRPEGGILRAAVPRWLNQPPCRARILAFATAQPGDGGAGALYVLLKKRRGPAV